MIHVTKGVFTPAKSIVCFLWSVFFSLVWFIFTLKLLQESHVCKDHSIRVCVIQLQEKLGPSEVFGATLISRRVRTKQRRI